MNHDSIMTDAIGLLCASGCGDPDDRVNIPYRVLDAASRYLTATFEAATDDMKENYLAIIGYEGDDEGHLPEMIGELEPPMKPSHPDKEEVP